MWTRDLACGGSRGQVDAPGLVEGGRRCRRTRSSHPSPKHSATTSVDDDRKRRHRAAGGGLSAGRSGPGLASGARALQSRPRASRPRRGAAGRADARAARPTSTRSWRGADPTRGRRGRAGAEGSHALEGDPAERVDAQGRGLPHDGSPRTSSTTIKRVRVRARRRGGRARGQGPRGPYARGSRRVLVDHGSALRLATIDDVPSLGRRSAGRGVAHGRARHLRQPAQPLRRPARGGGVPPTAAWSGSASGTRPCAARTRAPSRGAIVHAARVAGAEHVGLGSTRRSRDDALRRDRAAAGDAGAAGRGDGGGRRRARHGRQRGPAAPPVAAQRPAVRSASAPHGAAPACRHAHRGQPCTSPSPSRGRR